MTTTWYIHLEESKAIRICGILQMLFIGAPEDKKQQFKESIDDLLDAFEELEEFKKNDVV